MMFVDLFHARPEDLEEVREQLKQLEEESRREGSLADQGVCFCLATSQYASASWLCMLGAVCHIVSIQSNMPTG